MSDCAKRVDRNARAGCECGRCEEIRAQKRKHAKRRRSEDNNRVRAVGRANYHRTKGAAQKRYAKTPKGHLYRTYHNMKQRVCGCRARGSWAGKELLSSEEFYGWALDHPDFKQLYAEYLASGRELRLAPSIDRIDSQRGYTLDNMRWLTQSENSRLGATERRARERALR